MYMRDQGGVQGVRLIFLRLEVYAKCPASFRNITDKPYLELGSAVKTLGQYLNRIRHGIGRLGIIIFILLILFWLWLAAREPFISVFNGTVPRYGIGGWIFVIGFLAWALVKPKKYETQSKYIPTREAQVK